MNLRHLRSFVVIVDAGGFARAAPRLNISQPALSRQIHALEAELGVPLFDRLGRGVQLTSEGESLLRGSRALLDDVDSLSERVRSLKAGKSGVLRVGATPQVIESVLADFLVTYQSRHPGVEVHLVEEGGAHLPTSLERGEVHLSHIPVGDDRFHGRLVYPMHVLAVLPETHRLSRHTVLDIEDLANESLLRLGRGFASHAWVEAACQVAHIRPRVLAESTAPHTLIALARTGHGIALIPSPVRIPREGVRVVPLVHRGVSIGQWAMVAWDPRRFLAPYAKQFVDEYLSFTRRDFPGREFIRRAPPLPRPKEPAS